MNYAAVGLTLKAGARTLLDGFTQVFRPGEIWCVAGPNGAGKTTLLATLAGCSRRPADTSRSMAGRLPHGHPSSSRSVAR